jgi:two-component system alkaline phosphatase synthesis response regulator PhoP
MTTPQQTVWVVDDEPFICRSLSFVLRKGNYHVVEARNGEEALAAVREHKPDLVFMDVMMPKLNGFDVCAAIKQDPDLRSTRVILLTAKGQDSDREVGTRAGADAYMTKPFSPTKILERARELLAR